MLELPLPPTPLVHSLNTFAEMAKCCRLEGGGYTVARSGIQSLVSERSGRRNQECF